MKAIAIVLALAATAHADRWRKFMDLQGGAWLHYELTGLHALADTGTAPQPPAFTDLVLAGVRLHGFVGEGDNIGYHIGLDLAAGATLGGAGFAYDVALFPLGIGVHLGDSVIAIGTGIGAMGAVGTLDDAVMWPIEANAEIGGGRVRVLARARASWIAGADGRHDGAPSVPFADELDAMLGVRIGHHYEEYGFPSGNGYFVGVSYRELLDTRFVGLTIGYSIDLATQRRHRRACTGGACRH